MEATFSSAPRLSSSVHRDEVVQTTLSTPQMVSAELGAQRHRKIFEHVHTPEK